MYFDKEKTSIFFIWYIIFEYDLLILAIKNGIATFE